MTSYCFLDVTKIIIDLNKWEILHQMEWVSYHLYCMSQKKKTVWLIQKIFLHKLPKVKDILNQK